MLRPSALRQLLSQVTGGTIQATIFATRSGEFLDYVVKNENPQFNVKNVCAIICSVYQSFQKFSTPLGDNLTYLIVDCDMYRLAIKPVGNNHLVCVCADSNTGLGILKLKINSLTDSLTGLLNFAIYSQNIN
jgi:predicted regulator of Ras-like GTPase activity (Roadblock/LC7/MglB family)